MGLCRRPVWPQDQPLELSPAVKDTVSSRALAITRFSIICRCRDSVCKADSVLGMPPQNPRPPVCQAWSRGSPRHRRDPLPSQTAGSSPPSPASRPAGLPTCQRGLLQGLAGVQPRHPCLVGSLQLLVLQRRLLQRRQLPAGNQPSAPTVGHGDTTRGPFPAMPPLPGTPAEQGRHQPPRVRAHILPRALRLGDLQLLEDLRGQEGRELPPLVREDPAVPGEGSRAPAPLLCCRFSLGFPWGGNDRSAGHPWPPAWPPGWAPGCPKRDPTTPSLTQRRCDGLDSLQALLRELQHLRGVGGDPLAAVCGEGQGVRLSPVPTGPGSLMPRAWGSRGRAAEGPAIPVPAASSCRAWAMRAMLFRYSTYASCQRGGDDPRPSPDPRAAPAPPCVW